MNSSHPSLLLRPTEITPVPFRAAQLPLCGHCSGLPPGLTISNHRIAPQVHLTAAPRAPVFSTLPGYYFCLFLGKLSAGVSVSLPLTQCWLGRASDVRISPMAPSIWSVRPPACCGPFMMQWLLLTFFQRLRLRSRRHLRDWEETGHPARVLGAGTAKTNSQPASQLQLP